MSRTFCCGDIHGEYEKFMSCLQQVDFNYEKDTLIQLGDVVDRGPKSYECIEELLKMKNLISIKGNHDESWFNSLRHGDYSNGILWKEGARNTYASYYDKGINPEVHFDFFSKQRLYYIDDKRRYFVHGGFNRHHFIDQQPDITVFTWDRDFWMSALGHKPIDDAGRNYKIKGKPLEVFLGHTCTYYWGTYLPMNTANIWNLDTGCGKRREAPLTIMNVETKEYWQSK